MINIFEVNETNKMIEEENLDVRTITLGISLLDCIDADIDKAAEKIYQKIVKKAGKLVEAEQLLELAYAQNAFANHFFTDSFSLRPSGNAPCGCNPDL